MMSRELMSKKVSRISSKLAGSAASKVFGGPDRDILLRQKVRKYCIG